MRLIKLLKRLWYPAEFLFGRIGLSRGTPPEGPPVIDPYLGYATPDELILRGRVLSALRRFAPEPEQSRWVNFLQMLALFLTDEVAHVVVKADGERTVTDSEGYFTLRLPRNGNETGWHGVTAQVSGQPASAATVEALVPPPGPGIAVITDIDDTVMETGAYSLVRNLWTSLTGNALTRHVFPDAVELLTRLAEGGGPVFYVSSSPWNLHHFLTRVLERHGAPRGPLFLRDFGLTSRRFLNRKRGDHKSLAIDAILAAHPDRRFVLVGDTGQHDPHVYLEAARRHPGRIAGVILREPGRGPDRRDRRDMAALREMGLRVESGRDYREILSGADWV
ncbi:phosphatase domain-containing protein [Pseudooceanicola sp. 502str34]|uniref:phosphatase domain-containing protein n=1 Tax=Maritimibacter alkaliphilus TaxID=404236 RepID=UPI001C95E22F|nr:phosphatase domain-containing protein [Maritimibacter alkaliphilus]MBY6090369.1 DUF2183 domain-containing protein [Maritimibacter alkaliphilus]